MSNNTYSFFRFVFDCICSFFDGAFGGTPEPITSENRRITAVSFIGAVLFGIALFSALFFIDRKLDWNNKLSWLISIAFAIAVTLIYLAIVFCIFFA